VFCLKLWFIRVVWCCDHWSEDGRLLKLINTSRGRHQLHPVVVEVLQVFSQPVVHVHIHGPGFNRRQSRHGGLDDANVWRDNAMDPKEKVLVVASRVDIVLLPLQRCHKQTSCRQNIYCHILPSITPYCNLRFVGEIFRKETFCYTYRGPSYLKSQRNRPRLSINFNQFYLLKMSRDTHIRLFNCEQNNKAETSTNSCPTNKLYYKRKKTQRVQNSLRWRARTLYQVLSEVITVTKLTKIRWIGYRACIAKS